MKRFLIVDFDRSKAGTTAQEMVIRRCHAAFMRANGNPEILSKRLGINTYFYSTQTVNSSLFYANNEDFCFLASVQPYMHSGNRIVTAEFLLSLYNQNRESILREIVPPFAAIVRLGYDCPIIGMVDSWGLQHLYYCETDSYAAISPSSLLLAYLIRSSLDEKSVAIFSRVGHLLANSTFFQGVRKLPAGCSCLIKNGKCKIRGYSSSESEEQSRPSGDIVQSGTTAVKDCVRSCLEAYPNAAVQLSGGIDSRLVLSAIEPQIRSRMTAITVGSPDSPDLRIATRLTRIISMPHKIIDLTPLANLTKDEACRLAKDAAFQCDYALNPFARTVLHWIDKQIGYMPRLSGENGEIARGFYYPGQKDNSAPTEQLVERLMKWRICINDAADHHIFKPDFRSFALKSTFDAIKESFNQYHGRWLERTDSFYLNQRMQRFKGTDFSAFSRERPLLLPFFNQRFVLWATSVSCDEKRNNKLVAKLIHHLDPRLSSVPLNSGITVDCFLRPGFVAEIQRASVFLKKAVAVMHRRLCGKNSIAVGAASICHSMCQEKEPESLFPRVQKLPFIDGDSLRTVLLKTRSAYATFGLLLAMEWMLEYLED